MTPRVLAVALVGLVSAWRPLPAAAQGAWDAVLAVDPVPSPYLSDWDANPRFGTLTVVNGSGTTQSVRLVFSVVDRQGRVLATGRSEPQLVPPDAPAIFDDPFTIAGRTTHDTDLERQMRRTGRLAEGDYRACVAVVDLTGFQLAEACADFSVVYPDPPLLIAPFNGEAVPSADLFFQWTPVQVPAAFMVRYVFQLAEVQPGQLPAEALRSNIPHYTDPDVGSGVLQYPLHAQPLRAGARYAWRVQVLDQNGYPVSGNNGSSEVWTFRHGDGSDGGGGGETNGGMPVLLSLVDSEPAATAAAAPSAGSSAGGGGLNAVCTSWNQPAIQRFDVPAGAVAGWFGVRDRPANLFRHEHQGSRTFAFSTRLGDKIVFAYGDCAGVNRQTAWIHWIGIRTASGASSLDAMLSGTPDTTTPDTTAGLRFGVVFLAWHTMSIQAPPGFRAVEDFLDRNKIAVTGPGINAYGVLQLDPTGWWGPLKSFFGSTSDLMELQGFVGLAEAWSVGFSTAAEGSRRPSVDVSRERKYMILTASFPERRPVQGDLLYGAVQSMRLAVELTRTDSTEILGGEQGKVTTETILRFRHTIVVNDNFSLAGGVALDLVAEKKKDAATERKLDLILFYGASVKWNFFREFWIGNPALEAHIKLTGQRDAHSLALSGEAGWADWMLGKLGVSWSWEWKPNDPANPPNAMVNAQNAALDAQEELDRNQVKLARLYQEQPNLVLDELAENRAEIRRLEAERATLEARVRGSRDALQKIEGQGTWSRKRRWRLALGNIGLTDLLALVARAVTPVGGTP